MDSNGQSDDRRSQEEFGQALEPAGDTQLLDGLISDRSAKASAYRKRRAVSNERSVPAGYVDDLIEKGWEVARKGKRVTKLKQSKPHDQVLEDRTWCLLYMMGYSEINSDRFTIKFRRANGSTGSKQIDAFACDAETAVIAECKSRVERGRRSLQKDIGETVALQQYIRQSVFSHYRGASKPKLIWLYVTSNIIWSEADLERARDAGLYVVTENELNYFEVFLKHMGPAGRYQILGEFLRGQKIPAMGGAKVPAIRGSLGGHKFYSFVISARNLLKIAFVNHQALNHPDGRPAYQRMISSTRIKEISEFISKKGGFFPTNLLINFIESPRFDLISNKENTDPQTKFGWLTLPAVYRSAWIIDGQHRLYGYSGLEDKYLDQSLFVLAFDKMDTHKEADLFITINHKQKSVPRGLLVALLADLRMGDPDPRISLSALASAVVRQMSVDKSSSLYLRFALPDVAASTTQTSTQALTISEAVNGLNRSGLLGRVAHNTIVPGPFSGATDVETVERARIILNGYFEAFRSSNPPRWEAGRAGYMCVNPAIRAHLLLIPEIISYLSHRRSIDFLTLPEDQFIKKLVGFVAPILAYFRTADDEDVKKQYSRKFGEGGVKEYLYNLCRLLAAEYDDFGSEAFKRFVDQEASNAVDEANHFIMSFSETLMDCVITGLKSKYGERRTDSGEPAYWELGVTSRRVVENAFRKHLADPLPRRKPKEAYLDILDLKEIVEAPDNWLFFEQTFSIPLPGEKRGSKRHHTAWMAKFSEVRNIAAHKNALRTYTDDDLEFVDWVRAEIAPRISRGMKSP